MFTRTRVGRRVALRSSWGDPRRGQVSALPVINTGGMSVSTISVNMFPMPAAAGAARDAYLACLDRIAAEGLDANISVKLTQLGMGFNDALCVESLCRWLPGPPLWSHRHDRHGGERPHRDDARFLSQRTTNARQPRTGDPGVSRRTPDDLATLLPLGGHIRLCKGAYDEAEEIAFRSRDEVNTAYDPLARHFDGDTIR